MSFRSNLGHHLGTTRLLPIDMCWSSRYAPIKRRYRTWFGRLEKKHKAKVLPTFRFFISRVDGFLRANLSVRNEVG